MITTFSDAKKFMSLLADSPEVKAVLTREKRLAEEAEKQARVNCLERIKKLCTLESEAQVKFNAVLPALKAAEFEVGELKKSAAHLSNERYKVSYAHSQAMAELNLHHGEGFIQKTLYKLDRLTKEIQAEIDGLELAKNPFVKTTDGGFTVRPVNPNIATRQAALKQRIDTVQDLYATAKDLVGADMAPSEIKTHCESICEAIGQPMTTDKGESRD